MKTEPPKKKLNRWFYVAIVVVLILAGYIYWVTTRALPTIRPEVSISYIGSTVPAGTLPWPAYGQSAVGLNNSGVLVTNGDQKSVPMASTAKVITALSVLQKKPIAVGTQGPTITLSQSDVDIYDKYISEGGSVAKVVSGEKITEYQMLEAMMLPSADNMADSLAVWAFGSMANYTTYANQYLQSQGLSSTHVGDDASGFDPSTTSTASDLVKLGQLSAQNAVLTGIVAKTTATDIPIVGTITNINSLLGYDNVDGIKTGNTDQAGGVFLSSSKVTVNNQSVSVFTAIMGAPSLWQALHSSAVLVAGAQSNFASPPSLAPIHSGSTVGLYIVPWDQQHIYALSSQTVSVQSWKGTKVNATVRLKSISFNTKSGQTVGTISTSDSLLKTQTTTPVVVQQTASKPSKWWLILHPTYVL